MSTWNQMWVYGLKAPLTAWINAKKVDDGEGGTYLPHEIFSKGPCYETVETGVDEEGFPTYETKDRPSDKCIWMFSLYGDSADLVDEIKVLHGPFVIHEDISIEEMRELYPNFRDIPHLAR